MAPFRPLHLLLFLLFFAAAAAEPTRDRAALLGFLSGTPHGRRLQWNASSSACDWVGVTCDPNRTAVTALRLPGVGLLGPIPPSTLSLLSGLRVLSLRSNRLSGPIPPDFANLTQLRFLYLHRNHFSGPIPPGLAQLAHLNRLVLADNNLTGEIPISVNSLASLTHLYLENNGFSGEISSINLPGLIGFNVSNNRLSGSIPASLSRFPSSAFAGNLALCGGPLPPCAAAPAPSPSADEGNRRESSRKLSTAAIIGISVAAVAVFLLLMLILLLFLVYRRRRSRGTESRENKPAEAAAPASMAASVVTATETGTSSSKDDRGLGEVNKLVFVEQGLYSFDLEDLLRASAEVLGKGTLGTSYKAVLEDGTTVVVKRLKDVTAPKKEFELHLEALGKVKHPNVVPLRAFYYSKDEKLLVSDYVGAGSLSALLHGNRAAGRSLLDWHNRVRIALAAVRGISHLHLSANIVHGNLKASNILLRHDQEAAAVSDYGLTPLFGSAAPTSRVAGYRAPEVVETRRPTLKSDVYSYGVVVLELLTGRAPNQAYGEEGTDLMRWVQSVASEELTSEVFDPELVKYSGREDDMAQLLQIATACVSTVPDSRPGIEEVLKVVEEIASRTEGPSSDDPSKNGSGVPTSPAAATP